MSAPVLVINCGSSSIKYALVFPHQKQRIQGLAENLGTRQARLKATDLDGHTITIELPMADHSKALQTVLAQLGEHQPVAIGHRVVHGAEKVTKAVKITPDIISIITSVSPLAPLHNPANLLGIEATLTLFPDLPQVAVFDTAFHQSMPPHAYRYALPDYLYQDYAVRRYGFHGTSHAYVSTRASQLAGHPDQGGWLSAHLGNGCSTCAIWNGKSLDTSMGLTPLEGLVMGTRSGDIDPGLPRYLASTLGWSLEQIDNVLNRDSGLLGLSGLSNDMRTLVDAADHGHEQARLALDVFCYRLAKSLAAMSCALPHINGLIFTGGIGENSPLIRERTVALLPHFGFKLDPEKNNAMIRGAEGRIDQHSSPQIWVIPTDEEGRIAEETQQVLGITR